MAAVDYEREALKLLGLPHPQDQNLMKFHEIGTTELCDCADACRAVIARRLGKIRNALDHSAALPAAARAEIEAADFLSPAEYTDAVRRMVSIRERLNRIDNSERRQDFHRRHRPRP